MKTRLTLPFLLAAVVVGPGPLVAQGQELGQMASVTTWEIEASHLPHFMEVATQVTEAAKKAGLPAEYGWTMWQKQNTITIVGAFNRAELDDPDHWMKQFAGTPGEGPLMEAFQAMEGMEISRSWNEIHQGLPAWTYQPEGYESTTPPQYVHVFEVWAKSTMSAQQEMSAVMGDIVAFWKEIEYPYPVWGNVVRYGEARYMFVIPYSDPATYHGEKSFQALIENHMAGDKWQDLETRLTAVMVRGDDSHHQFLPNQSYAGPGM